MIICCGEALIDMAPASDKGDTYTPRTGGSPYNTAIAIGKLGVPVKFLGRISTDYFGEILMKKLQKSRVGEELLKRSAQNSTLAFVKLEKGKEPQYIFYTADTADFSLVPEDLPQKIPIETNCIVFGSISMTIEPIASTIESLILREGTRKSTDQMDGVPVISFDPNVRPHMIKDRNVFVGKFEKWISASTIAKMSFADIEYVYPKLEVEKALKKIISMGPWLAICTLGSKGAVAMLRRNDGSVIKASTLGVNLPVVDTIGAGDTFHGAFLSWLELKGKMSRSELAALSETDLNNSLNFANKAAAIVCSRRGADPPSRKEVENLKIEKSPPAKKEVKKG